MRPGGIALQLLVCGVFSAASPEPSRAQPVQNLRMDVDSAQRISLDGSTPSLKNLLEELSWRAGFELRSFGIDDRPVFVNAATAPLADVLRRLLAHDLFTVGLSVGPDATTRITWLEVPGPLEPAGHRRREHSVAGTAAAPSGPQRFRVPVGLFLAAFDAPQDEAARLSALRVIEGRVLEHPEQRDAFLQASSESLADAFVRYPQAPTVLREIMARQTDERVRQKLEQLVALLVAKSSARSPQYTPSRSPLADFLE